MSSLHFATSNKGKAASLRRVLAAHGVDLCQVDMDLPEPQVVDLRTIAETKVRAAFEHVREPIIAQDSGFFIPAWGGFPGPFVKFALQTLGLEGFATLARERAPECEFRECLAYVEPTRPGCSDPAFFEAVVSGQLATQPRGVLRPDSWSELHRLFMPAGYDKTVAEMTEQEVAEWRSNRGDNSADAFARWFVQEKCSAR